MNERLTFSWAHIIAALAILATLYISFVGFTYMADGDFAAGLLGMAAVGVLEILFFIVPQQLKASGVKMARKIKWERFLFWGAIPVMLIIMLPINHFLAVNSHDKEVKENFHSAMQSAGSTFDDYEAYTDSRMQAYADALTLQDAQHDEEEEKRILTWIYPEVIRETQNRTLRLQLRSQNYDTLRNVSRKWLAEADGNVSTWNVFLLGNIHKIKAAVKDWHDTLSEMSARRMYDEAEVTGGVPQFESDSYKEAGARFDHISDLCRESGFNVWSIAVCILLYCMLMLPYAMQERHSKSTWRLIGSETQARRPRRGGKVGPIISPESSHDKSSHEDASVTVEPVTGGSENDYISF